MIEDRQLGPKEPDALLEFGMVWRKIRAFKNALPALEKGVRVRPGRDRFSRVLGIPYLAKVHQEEASARSVKKRPANPIPNHASGSALCSRGNDTETADSRLRKSIRSRLAQVAGYYYRGGVILEQECKDWVAQLSQELLIP